ncbi:acyl-CoA N-acyltransferase [Multifurca ochricompacta]|uniref:Histone acetyltransferase type B catalytic subunit n=1 Tax=Multifurca ochricompacta TaxID=376703 RepID=A0AAD4QPS9_9AGAM|nr:acyl-CoA N-acyltransferase [Multifurca ochricompacta]
MTDWTTNSTDALHLSLVRSSQDKEALGDNESYENFHPTFTYPIYGEDEKIYGYTDLVIDLRFASGSLAHFLQIKYSSKLASLSTLDDVQGTLQKFIPEDYYQSEAEFLARVEEDATSFRPSGEKIYSYTRAVPYSARKGKGVAMTLPEDDPDAITYEVWHVRAVASLLLNPLMLSQATWKTPGFREYHRRMQLFILLYIEAGSYIDEVEDSWEFVVLYEKRKRRTSPDTETYHFVGYSTLYPFYCFPDKTRLRLSQFVIVPPYQHQGHGSALYNAIYQYVLAQPCVTELTVEDPAEAFEDLRDRNDLAMLLGHVTFMAEAFGAHAVSHDGGRVGRVRTLAKGKSAGKLGPPSDRAWLERWRKELKIAGRQFHRLVEMLIQLNLNPADARAARAYRLQVKERLYRFNYEALVQLEEKERLEKLEETFQSVREDYQRILAMVR